MLELCPSSINSTLLNEEEVLWFEVHEVTFEMRGSKVASKSTDAGKAQVPAGRHPAGQEMKTDPVCRLQL